MPIIQCDTRQKMGKLHHKVKEDYFESCGYTLVHSKCLVGDYVVPSNGSVSVDTKQSLGELYSDLIQDHERFHNECVLAKECGIKLYVVVENNEFIKSVDDVKRWKNPLYFAYWRKKKAAESAGKRPPKPPVDNIHLIKIMHSMTRDYGVEFLFCKTSEAGHLILELLNKKGE